MKAITKTQPILVTGDAKLSFSIAICLLQSEYAVVLFTPDVALAQQEINKHLEAITSLGNKKINVSKLNIIADLSKVTAVQLAIAITEEKLKAKKSIIKQLENNLSSSTLIAINTESIGLELIQTGAINPSQIIGLNWVEPAHTTFFLELIINKNNNKIQVDALVEEAKKNWNKDPYIISDAISIRSRLFCAMAREAFYLIENGYATVQDIDRACRNDAGYYLPFAGNFRYMDLMGTYSYAEVMKKLNSDLSKDTHVPKLLADIVGNGGLGMENNKGFYTYQNGDTSDWEKLFTNFSYKIQKIIEKYPFNYDEK